MTHQQLSLFKGRRLKPALALEFETHCAVADTLRVAASRGWIWSHFPSGELRDKGTAARLYRMGLKRGFADFLLISPHGLHHWLELKRGNAHLSEHQQAFSEAMRARGVPCEVARNYQQAIDQLLLWGALRSSLKVTS